MKLVIGDDFRAAVFGGLDSLLDFERDQSERSENFEIEMEMLFPRSTSAKNVITQCNIAL